MKLVTFVLAMMLWIAGFGQKVSFEKQNLPPVPLFKTLNVSEQSSLFCPFLEKIEAPSPGGTYEKIHLANQEDCIKKIPCTTGIHFSTICH